MGVGYYLHFHGMKMELKEIEILNTVSRPMTPLRFRWVFVYSGHRKAGVWSSYLANDLTQDAMIQPRGSDLQHILIESINPFKQIEPIAQVAAKNFVTIKWVAIAIHGGGTSIIGIELHSCSEVLRAEEDGTVKVFARDFSHDKLFHYGKE